MKPITIGNQYLSAGKHPQLCTVTDIWTTCNAKGSQVKIRYVATHKLMGKTVTDYDVCETAIRIGFHRLGQNSTANAN